MATMKRKAGKPKAKPAAPAAAAGGKLPFPGAKPPFRKGSGGKKAGK
jgi:hypothetical protein